MKVVNIGSLPQACEIVKYFFITSLVIIRLNINCADGGGRSDNGVILGNICRLPPCSPLPPPPSVFLKLSFVCTGGKAPLPAQRPEQRDMEQPGGEQAGSKLEGKAGYSAS